MANQKHKTVAQAQLGNDYIPPSDPDFKRAMDEKTTGIDPKKKPFVVLQIPSLRGKKGSGPEFIQWRNLQETLYNMGSPLDPADVEALWLVFCAIVAAGDAMLAFNKDLGRLFIKTKDGKGNEVIKPSPYWAMVKDTQSHAMKMLASFGMTPRSRNILAKGFTVQEYARESKAKSNAFDDLPEDE